jgi:hypothetical protein
LQHFGSLAILFLSGHFLVGMATLAPETFWGLLAMDSDVTEPLAVAALCEVGLVFVCFDLYYEVVDVGKGEDLRLCQGH